MIDRKSLSERSARIGYNVGFGARRHFATYDIVEKVPAYFGVVTFAFGIIFLKYQNTDLADIVAVSTSILGFAIFYLNFYSNEKDKYSLVGKDLNILYNKVNSIYDKVQSCPEAELAGLENELNSIHDQLQKMSIHKQVFLSNELAHFKLFGESKSDWFVKELKLGFWKDMIPAVWRVYGVILIAFSIVFLFFYCGISQKAIEFLNACKG